MKKIFLMLALVMGLSVTSGCQKESNEWYEVTPEATASLWEAEDYELEELKRKHRDHECDFTEYVDYDGSTWECYDAYCEYKKIGRHAPKSTAQKFYDDISGESDLSRVYSDDETQAEAVAETKIKRGVYATSESISSDSNNKPIHLFSWENSHSYLVRLKDLGIDSSNREISDDEKEFTVNVFYPDFVSRGDFGRILVEVTTDEEVLVGVTSFMADDHMYLVHGSMSEDAVTVHINHSNDEFSLEFYTGATIKHYKSRPTVDSGYISGQTCDYSYTMYYTFTRYPGRHMELRGSEWSPMPTLSPPRSEREEVPLRSSSDHEASSYVPPTILQNPRIEQKCRPYTFEEETTEEATEDTVEKDLVSTRSICFFPRECNQGEEHTAQCYKSYKEWCSRGGGLSCWKNDSQIIVKCGCPAYGHESGCYYYAPKSLEGSDKGSDKGN